MVEETSNKFGALSSSADKELKRTSDLISSDVDNTEKYTLYENKIVDGEIERVLVEEKEVVIKGEGKEATFKELYGISLSEIKALKEFGKMADRKQYVIEKKMANKLRSHHNPFKAD